MRQCTQARCKGVFDLESWRLTLVVPRNAYMRAAAVGVIGTQREVVALCAKALTSTNVAEGSTATAVGIVTAAVATTDDAVSQREPEIILVRHAAALVVRRKDALFVVVAIRVITAANATETKARRTPVNAAIGISDALAPRPRDELHSRVEKEVSQGFRLHPWGALV